MRIVDSRRLRGPNLQTPGPAALAEVAFEEGESPDRAVAAWRRELARMLAALGWDMSAIDARARVFEGGAALTFAAPIDLLMTATEINEWAIASASESGRDETAPRELEPAREELADAIAKERRPELVALQVEAARRRVPFLWDDDAVTLGMARRSRTFAIDALPSPDDVPWEDVGAIPVALVTGTNGKTTCARLVARIAKEAGLIAGNTSTDGVAVDETIVEPGDWTGPGAARLLLRRPEVELAVLESARGGLLRRGLAIDACDAALITNVSRDHLGEFGVNDLETMARTKAVVGSVVRPEGRVILNADDASLVALAPTFHAKVVFFSLGAAAPGTLRPTDPSLRSGVRADGEAWVVRDRFFVRVEGPREVRILPVAEAPITFGGAAEHNVANALAAAATARALGLDDRAIAAGLKSFDAKANPGRGQLFALASGARVLADFGHNPDGMKHVLTLARSLAKGGRLAVVAAQPGDRRDADIAAFAAEIARAGAALAIAWDMTSALRGRAEGEVPRLLEQALAALGVNVAVEGAELDAVKRALEWSRAGDLIVVAPNIDRAGLAALLPVRDSR